MRKTYVLDTNVLIQAPYALDCFEDNDLVLPLAVLEELDGLKKAEGERGANARAAIRALEWHRCRGDLLEGVPLESGGTLRVESNCVDVTLPDSLSDSVQDNRILRVCKGLHEQGGQIVLVTKDILLRLKAQMLGLAAEDFTTEQAPENGMGYTGRIECYAPEARFRDFRKRGVPCEELYQTDEAGNVIRPSLTPNQFVVLHADQSNKKTQLGRVCGEKVVALEYIKRTPYGVKPRSAGQYFLQEALMQPAETAPLVIVRGMAGTAKTFYSLAVGLEKLLCEGQNEYRRILICRPNAQFDLDIGFLPGDEQEKISPLLRPVMDNLEQLIDSNDAERYRDEAALQDKIREIFARGIIQAEAMNFIRGRSIAQTYLIIDEAQNMTPAQVKGVITRAGKGTKIILLGDPGQIDRPYLDERTNGLSYAAAHMQGSPLCWQLTLDAGECERSPLAMDAIHRL
ncbi:MAG TPA: PhoH family protein [Candidatus Agathobaculum pullistercoris]|nr:PhoH family protein [uncultured Agathobaculum sp.]HIX10872.1 PhoH family protein [Candidatus Agathobaculum pullistercoris]